VVRTDPRRVCDVVVVEPFPANDTDGGSALWIYCSRAPNPGEAHIRRTADKLEARWHGIETGHYPMLSTPDELTRIILNV
jgi:hypothetical protein